MIIASTLVVFLFSVIVLLSSRFNILLQFLLLLSHPLSSHVSPAPSASPAHSAAVTLRNRGGSLRRVLGISGAVISDITTILYIMLQCEQVLGLEVLRFEKFMELHLRVDDLAGRRK